VLVTALVSGVLKTDPVLESLCLSVG
jgi:hypothetical protein